MSILIQWSITKTILTLTGINLFLDGGGSFLWFIPAIMLIYLVLPLYNKLDKKNNITIPIITIVTWLLFTILTSIYTNYNEIFILTNRLPIILIGVYCAKYNIVDILDKKKYTIIIHWKPSR